MITLADVVDAFRTGRELKEEEVIAFLVQQVQTAQREFLAPPAFIGGSFSKYLRSKEVCKVMKRYRAEVEPVIQQYGPSSGWGILHLDPCARVPLIIGLVEVIHIDYLIRTREALGVILLANDAVIEPHQKEFEDQGFSFPPDWKESGSVYKRMLAAAEKYGHVFNMVKQGSFDIWDYKERTRNRTQNSKL